MFALGRKLPLKCCENRDGRAPHPNTSYAVHRANAQYGSR